MVLEDLGGLLGSQIACGRADGLESTVGWRKDGDILRAVQDRGEVCGLSGAEKGGQVGVDGDGREVARDLEQAVDDMDNTASEVQVLPKSLVSSPR